MTPETKLDKFAKYAWFVLGYNVLVILWGVFLRASKSGDGCGQHWLTCNGEVVPSAPQLKTVIEFSHRVTSSLAGIFVIILLIWAYRRWRRLGGTGPRSAMRFAGASFLFVVIEGLLGAGLVLTGNTAENLTPMRPVWMAAHLINTFVLLAMLTLTARFASGLGPMRMPATKHIAAIAIGILAVFIVGTTGSIAALSNMIFPSGTLAEGWASDFSPTSSVLLRLRLLHPITAILTGVFLVFLTSWLAHERNGDRSVDRWSSVLSLLVLVQIAFGSLTLLMLAPIILQLGHLFLVDAIWISYIMLASGFLSSEHLPSIGSAAEGEKGVEAAS